MEGQVPGGGEDLRGFEHTYRDSIRGSGNTSLSGLEDRSGEGWTNTHTKGTHVTPSTDVSSRSRVGAQEKGRKSVDFRVSTNQCD